MIENIFLGGKGGASFQNFIIHSIGVSSSSYQSVLIGANPGSFDGGRGALPLISLVPRLEIIARNWANFQFGRA